MNLEQRIDLLVRLGNYMEGNEPDWQSARQKAFDSNHWFILEFIDLAVHNIAHNFLREPVLRGMAERYKIPGTNASPKKVGIVMAGNLPLVGFHDFLCTFLAGHYAFIKLSSKDEVLMKQLATKLVEWAPEAAPYGQISELIRNCDAYIATGSNNSGRYFEYYFAKYPHIIRRNRTSVAILWGNETRDELEKLADDVYQYFGLGCRNVTKIYVPSGYDFVPLLEAFRKYDRLANHHKYKNNYDYNLAVLILNNRYYMSNESLLLVEDAAPFSPIAQLHYEFYTDAEGLTDKLLKDERIQCVVSRNSQDFGSAQTPGACDFADRIDTMQFLLSLK